MRTKFLLLLLLPLIVLLAACSASAGEDLTSSPNTGPGQNQPGQNSQGQPPDMSKQPLELKLAAGTLMLEGGDNAITAEQAKALLPLWKAVKALNSNSGAADQEISAVYAQIQDTMTAEQVQAIKDMSLSLEDTRALMNKYGIAMPQNPGGELSDSERATRIAQFQAERGSQGGSQGSGGMPRGDFPGGGMPGAGQRGRNSSTPGVQNTPQPAQSGRGMRGGSFNLIFVDPLIQLLMERAGA